MEQQPVMKAYHQSRWVCLRHGYFDIRLPKEPPKSFRARCPDCERPADSREGYECAGKTIGPVPYRSKPRLSESPEIEVALFTNSAVRKTRKGYYNRHTRRWTKTPR